jgi:hypothetical protein
MDATARVIPLRRLSSHIHAPSHMRVPVPPSDVPRRGLSHRVLTIGARYREVDAIRLLLGKGRDRKRKTKSRCTESQNPFCCSHGAFPFLSVVSTLLQTSYFYGNLRENSSNINKLTPI